MRKSFSVLVIVCICLCLLTGCMGAVLTGLSGTFVATACYLDGEEVPLDGEYLELDSDGTGAFCLKGERYDLVWSLSGDYFSFEDEDGDRFDGTCNGIVIEGDYFDGYSYVFELEQLVEETEEESSFTAADEAEMAPASGHIFDYDVSIVGAEPIVDMDGKEGIRIYWDFTNNSDDVVYPYEDLYIDLEQNGRLLDTTYCTYEDDAPEYGNDYLYLRPGVSIRCCSEFTCDMDGDPVTVSIYHWMDEEEKIMALYDPADLPGRPDEDMLMETVSDPAWTESLPTEGEFDGDYYVSIDGAEVVKGWEEGTEVLRVYFTFTNNSEEEASMWWNTNVRAMQDGVEVLTDWPETDVEEDENFDLDIAPGESIRCSECYVIRSDSPIEIEVYEFGEGAVLGTVFEVK